MKTVRFLFGVAFSIFLLQGCGGGGGGGSSLVSVPTYAGLTTAATVDNTSSRDLSTAATSGAMQAVVSGSAEGVILRPAPSMESKVVDVSPKIAQWIGQNGGFFAGKRTNMSATICTSGGSAIADTNDAETVGTITFANCGIDDGYGGVLVFNGTVDYTYNSGADSLSMVFHMTVSYAGDSQSINMTIACASISGSPVCTVSSDFVGLDDRTYRVTNIGVTGDAYSGFYVDATVYDPDHGYITMTTTSPILFDCPTTGVPSTGTITINGASASSATISFDSCSSFTVTINSVAEVFNW